MQEYMLFINLFVIFNFSLLITFLLLKKSKQKDTYFLIILILILINTSINNLILYYFKVSAILFTQLSFGGINLIYGPILLALVFFLQEKELPKSWKWHFIPAVGFFIYGLSYLFISQELKEVYFKQMLNGEHLLVNILNFFIIIHAMFYMIIAKKQLNNFKISKENPAFWVLQLKLRWANDFIKYQIIAAVIMFLGCFISLVLLSKPVIFCDMVVGPCVSMFIYSFTVYMNFQFNIVYERVTNPIIEIKDSKSTIRNLSILGDKGIELKNRLELHLEKYKSYADAEINLQKLADELEVSPTFLSQTINQNIGVNFTDYINNFRIEEAKKLLISDKQKHLKVDAIGEMAGFNSRSTFYSIFKKNTGISPAAFKNKIL